MTPLKCWWAFFHVWNKWESYAWTGTTRILIPGTSTFGEPIETSERRQKRSCSLCGREQDRLVRQS